MTCMVFLGLNRGRGYFLNLLGAPMILKRKIAVIASLRWFTMLAAFLSFQLITSGV